MRITQLLVLPFLLGALACSAIDLQDKRERVLFVGNSLTYVGNVPALYSALAAANGHHSPSDMIVRGGATLIQRADDGSVAKALASGKYRSLVLQERGGDLMCSFGPESCVKSREAVKVLAALGKEHRVAVVLLGSYQPHPSFSRQLVEQESAAAREAGIPYIEVSQKLQQLRSVAPDFAWFAPDGSHPGRELALLNGILVYQALQGTLPAPRALTVKAPIYGSTSGLQETLRPSNAPPPMTVTPLEIHYTSAVLEKLLGFVGNTAGSSQFTQASGTSPTDLEPRSQK